MNTADIRKLTALYLEQFPEEQGKFAEFQKQLKNEAPLNNRKTFPGHVTGAALVLSPQRDKVLLIHHKFFDTWLQPGGHWDPGEPDPWSAARREAEEETGIQIAEQLAPFADRRIPLDIETQRIPARADKGEPEHYHHDFRYVFLAASEQLAPLVAEVHSAAWVSFDDPRLAAHNKPWMDKLRRFKFVA